MGFDSFGKYGDAFEDGKYHYQYLFKTVTPTPSAANTFVDLNQTSGHPKYNAFVGSQATFTPLTGSGNGGIYPGPFGSGSSTKHLMRWNAMNPGNASGGTAAPPDMLILCDYLGFYPLIDCDDTSEQSMDNTLSLTRYTTGDDVRIALIVTAPMTSTASLAINYTNSEGVTGCISEHNVYPGTTIGSCATATGTGGAVGNVTPFWPFAGGCRGVRSVESVTFASSAGGFICMALVKPLAYLNCYEQGVTSEKMFGFEVQNPPEIKSGAYLNLMLARSNTAAGTLRSEFVFINS